MLAEEWLCLLFTPKMLLKPAHVGSMTVVWAGLGALCTQYPVFSSQRFQRNFLMSLLYQVGVRREPDLAPHYSREVSGEGGLMETDQALGAATDSLGIS